MEDRLLQGLRHAQGELQKIASLLDEIAVERERWLSVRKQIDSLLDEAQSSYSPNLRAITDVLQERVYEVLKNAGKPLSPKAIFKAIDGPALPLNSRQLRNWLSREVQKGNLYRPGEGYYMIPPT